MSFPDQIFLLCFLLIVGVPTASLANPAVGNTSETLSSSDLISTARKVDYGSPELTATVEGRTSIAKQRVEGREAFSELKKRGDAIIDAILFELKKDEDQGILYNHFREECLSLFIEINTEKSRKARKEACLCLLTPNRSVVERDLGRPRAEENRLGIEGIRGLELDEDLLPLVLRYVTRERVLSEALDALQDDPSDKYSDRKVQAILEGLSVVEKWENANCRLGNTPYAFGNRADNHYWRSIQVLCALKGQDVNGEISSRIASLPDSTPKDCLVTALANRGEFHNQRSALVALLQNQRNRTFPHLRVEAVKAFELSGEKEDLPFLQELAGSDPYCYEDYLGLPRHERWKDEYINLTMDQIEHPDGYFLPKQVVLKGTPTPQKITYPIREAAKKAIQAIEARTGDEGKSATPKPESGEREK